MTSADPSAGAPGAAAPGVLGTVVIADDSPTIRRIVARVLEGAGWRVVPAADGLEAVQAVHRVQPDVVVVDGEMPRLTGWVATRILRDDPATADVPLLMLTALSGASERYWAQKAGGDRYLTKDFRPAELAAAVAELAQRRPRTHRGPTSELTDADVLQRTMDVLDRSLFQASVITDVMGVSSSTQGFEGTVAALLEVVARVVDCHLSAVVLGREAGAWLSVSRAVSTEHLQEFLRRSGEALGLDARDFEVLAADPGGLLGGDDDADLVSWVALPLHGYGGTLIGLLAVSSDGDDGFADAALDTLSLVGGAAALVVDAARLTELRLLGRGATP